MIAPVLQDDGEVAVDMGVPRWKPADIPFVADDDAVVRRLDVDGAAVEITVVSMGNPHAVQVVRRRRRRAGDVAGPADRAPPALSARVNAGYMQVRDRANIRLRVWERGAGETLACGTGACAAVAAGIMRGLLDPVVRVETRGGTLTIAWPGPGAPVTMTGPATTVFEGEIEVPG